MSDAVSTDVGTTNAPVALSATMQAGLDHDIYEVTLDERSRLLVLGTGGLDTEALVLTEECVPVGSVVRDVGSLPDTDPANRNFLASADLDAGTYYLVVFEWASRQGDYGVEFALGEEVSRVPNAGPIPDQEVALDESATVFVPVEDDDGDLRHVTAISEDPDTLAVGVRPRSGVWQLVLNPVEAGTTTVHVLATDWRGQVGTASIDVAVTSPTSSAPEVAAGDADGQLNITFEATLEPQETRAYDFQLRGKRPQLPWENVGCVEFENSASTGVTEDLSVVVNGLHHGVPVDARYRSRESASCDTGNPAPWSSTGSGSIGGTPVNQPPSFDDVETVEREVGENSGGGLNVGAPVAALDPDGVRDELAYNLRGPDADSFDIVPTTGQIRTRPDIVYDFETRTEYDVDVEAVDVFGEKDEVAVTIAVGDLDANCATPENVRLNAGDGRLWVRWSPVAQDSDLADVLGYEIGYRAGTTGGWSRLTVQGQGGRFIEILELINGLDYSVRVRPVGYESDCGWSVPVKGTPTTDRAPGNVSDFNDRFVPHDRLGDWSFPVPGRCAEHRGDEQTDCSHRYRKAGPHRGTITLEYDDERPGCAVDLLFSSLTAGSFLDECGDAGVRTPFQIAPPQRPESPPAPQNSSDFNKLVFGNDTVLPGFFFGRYLYIPGRPDCRGITANGKNACEPAYSGFVWIQSHDGGTSGRYWYEPKGWATGQLEVEFIEGAGCRVWGDRSCVDPDDGGDRIRLVFDLKFEGSDIATFTVTTYRNGHRLGSNSGTLDFRKDSPGSRLPRELLPPRSPPQAAGKDRSGVTVAAPHTTQAITGDSLQSLLVRNSGIQPATYRPGDWLEPKDGTNQRMMVVGADHGTAAVALSPKRYSAGFRTAALASAEPEFTRLAVVCMQQDSAIPVRGSRFFSRPKAASGPVQTCQRDCVLADSKTTQACVWDCEDGAAVAGVRGIGMAKSAQLPRLVRDRSPPHLLLRAPRTPVLQDRPSLLVRPGVTITLNMGGS